MGRMLRSVPRGARTAIWAGIGVSTGLVGLFLLTVQAEGFEAAVGIVLGTQDPYELTSSGLAATLGLLNVLVFPVLFGLAVGAVITLVSRVDMKRSAAEIVEEALENRQEKFGRYDVVGEDE